MSSRETSLLASIFRSPIKCAGPPLFRSQEARDFACLLDDDGTSPGGHANASR